MEDKYKHRLNGESTGILKAIPLGEGEKEAPNKKKKLNMLLRGIKKMASPVLTLINNIASKINSLVDMFSKIHFAAPYMLIIAALHYSLIIDTPLLLAWLAFLSGASIVLMCLVIWINAEKLDYLHKQKWGIFWIISAQTILQIMTITEGAMFGQVVGGLFTLASLPFYIYFNFMCEDKHYNNEEIERKKN
jgi:hypothetical protein